MTVLLSEAARVRTDDLLVSFEPVDSGEQVSMNQGSVNQAPTTPMNLGAGVQAKPAGDNLFVGRSELYFTTHLLGRVKFSRVSLQVTAPKQAISHEFSLK